MVAVDWGGWARLLPAAGLIGGFMWLTRRRGVAVSATPVMPDLPSGAPYRVHTRGHDLVLRGRDVAAAMRAADDAAQLPAQRPQWGTIVERVDLAERRYRAVQAEAILPPAVVRDAGRIAVLVLVDQSGSMRDRIVDVAVAVRVLDDMAVRTGLPLCVAGFTTVGWRGGQSRRDWLEAGALPYPGRLCDLLHIGYRPFDGPLAHADWRAMLDPMALRENVDGEALLWATGLLGARPEPLRLLIVLSDGAPVDDSTLQANGSGILDRHVRQVIGEIEDDGTIRLGAIGLGFDVGRYYAVHDQVDAASAIDSALIQMIDRLITADGKDESA